MMKFRLFVSAFALTLGLGSVVSAANPKIHALKPDELIAGAVMNIEGADFSDVAGDVQVMIGGMNALVLGATFDELTVFVPNLKPGKHNVVVSIGSAKSKESLSVTVSKNDAEAQEREKNRQLDKYEKGGEVAAVMQTVFLELNPSRVVREKGQILFEVSGVAKYPDRCVIIVNLKLDNRFITSVRIKVRGGRFQGKIGPFARQLFAGNYAVEAEFSLRGQPSRIVRQFNKAYPDPKVRGARERAFDRVYARMGTVQDERSDMTRIRTHFDGQLRRVTELLADLDDNFCTTGRSIFRTGDGAVQEAKWEEWLKKRSLRGLGEERFLKKAGKLAKERSYLSSKNFFDDVAWREWLDVRWRGDVIQLAKSHVKFRDRWAVVKHPEAVDMMGEALAVLIQLSQRRSQELYTKNDLPVHANDKAVKGADVLQLASNGRASPARIRGLIRKIQKELGLQSR